MASLNVELETVAPGTNGRLALPRTRSLVAASVYFAVLALLVMSAAELTARVQDWVRYGTPLTATPNSDADLFVNTPTGRRGKPNGRYKKWKLNEFGFRSGNIALQPPPGVTRVAIIGSSETFGLYESPDREFPAQLEALLTAQGRYEVVNTGLTGLTLHTAVTYWQAWVSRFRPQVVVIYPSPLFYLNDSIVNRSPELRAAPVASAPAPAPAVSRNVLDTAEQLLADSRLVDHARDKWDFPDFIQRRRDARAIAAVVNAHRTDWVFTNVPVERVQLFVGDLAELVHAVQQFSVNVIVLTHASSVLDPPRPADMRYLIGGRTHAPRATPEVIGRFMTLTNEAIRSWCQSNGVSLIDVAPVMNGHDELFGDLIHFSDAGAGVMARLIAAHLVQPGPAVSQRAGQAALPGSTHAVQ